MVLWEFNKTVEENSCGWMPFCCIFQWVIFHWKKFQAKTFPESFNSLVKASRCDKTFWRFLTSEPSPWWMVPAVVLGKLIGDKCDCSCTRWKPLWTNVLILIGKKLLCYLSKSAITSRKLQVNSRVLECRDQILKLQLEKWQQGLLHHQ